MVAIYAGQYGPEGLEYPDGRPARNAEVFVTRINTGLPAVLYDDELKSNQVPNPCTTDEYGNLVFFASPGAVAITVNGHTMNVLVPIHPNDPGFGVTGDGQGGYTHVQSDPVSLIQIIHHLPWNPAGVLMKDFDGNIQDYASVSYPQPGVTEIGLEKGLTFTGRVYLS